MRIPTTWLYVPSVDECIMRKAIASSTDVVIFDLEDSVPECEKNNARNNVKKVFNDNKKEKLSCVRINAISTAEGIADLLFLRENNICPDYILLPKASVEKDSWFVGSFLEVFEKPPKIFILIETVSSFMELRSVVNKPDYLYGVFFGSADFSADLCVNPSNNDFKWARQEITLHANRLNMPAIDTPFFNIYDREANIRHAQQARDMGFVGIQLIHPKQLDDIKFSFSLEKSHYQEIMASIDDASEKGDCAVQRFNNHVFGPPLVRYIRNVEKLMGDNNAD